MQFHDTPEQAGFRAAAREFLKQYAGPFAAGAGGTATSMFVLGETEEAEFVAQGRAWQRTKYEHGWAGINWPAPFGLGRSDIDDAIFREEEAAVVSPWLTHNLGFGLAAPTVLTFGSPAQQETLVPRMLRGEDVWCQLFSEPSAGSDLGGVRTSAVAVDGGWVINGQKVWSSKAHFADRGLLVARSDPEATKYRGITVFALDMAAPGIEVRRIRQMNGAAHFCEVFFTDVFVPGADVLGTVNGGWPVALSTLAGERRLIGVVGGGIDMADVVDAARRCGRHRDPVVRDALARAWIRDRVLAYLGYRVRAAAQLGVAPGPESSVIKLALAEHVSATTGLVLGIVGPAGLLSGNDAVDDGRWTQQFLGEPAYRIGGGTSEIQRTTIAERVLGLPAEPRVDKEVPFRAIPF